MMYLAQTYPVWLALAAVLGLLVGWFTWLREGNPSFWSDIGLWILAIILALFVVAARLLPERPGFWFDLGTLLAVVYFIACFLGATLRRMMQAEPELAVATSAPRSVVQQAPVPAAAPPEPAPAEVGKPTGLAAARGGIPDDLKRISGIGRQNEGRLHALGIWHYDQIARWTDGEVEWVGQHLAFPGRIEREEWVAQAARLARGEVTEFAKRVDAGEVETSIDEKGDHGQSNIAKLPDPDRP